MADVTLSESALLCSCFLSWFFTTFCMHIRACVDYCLETAQDSNLSFFLTSCFLGCDKLAAFQEELHCLLSDVKWPQWNNTESFLEVITTGRWAFGVLERYILDNCWAVFHHGSWGQARTPSPQSAYGLTLRRPLFLSPSALSTTCSSGHFHIVFSCALPHYLVNKNLLFIL